MPDCRGNQILDPIVGLHRGRRLAIFACEVALEQIVLGNNPGLGDR